MQIQLLPENVDKVIKATCVLHNFIQKTFNQTAAEDGQQQQQQQLQMAVGSEEGEGLQCLRLPGNHASREALLIRDQFQNYFKCWVGTMATKLFWPCKLIILIKISQDKDHVVYVTIFYDCHIIVGVAIYSKSENQRHCHVPFK